MSVGNQEHLNGPGASKCGQEEQDTDISSGGIHMDGSIHQILYSKKLQDMKEEHLPAYTNKPNSPICSAI
jgi:hypothetical protein